MDKPIRQSMALDLSPITHRDQLSLSSHQGLFDYWQRLCGTQTCPCYSQMDVLELDRSLLPWLVVAEHDTKRGDYLYRLVGTGIDEHNGFYATGQYLADLPLANKADIRASLDRVVETRQPHFSASRYIGVHRYYKLARRLLLPLVRTAAEPDVGFVLCAIEFKQA